MEPAQLTGTRMLPCSRSIKIKIPGTLVPAITGIAFPWGLSSVQGPPCRCDSGGARTSPAAVRRQRQRRPPDNGARLRHRLATKLHEAFPFSCPGAAGAVAESGPPTCSAAAPPPRDPRRKWERDVAPSPSWAGDGPRPSPRPRIAEEIAEEGAPLARSLTLSPQRRGPPWTWRPGRGRRLHARGARALPAEGFPVQRERAGRGVPAPHRRGSSARAAPSPEPSAGRDCSGAAPSARLRAGSANQGREPRPHFRTPGPRDRRRPASWWAGPGHAALGAEPLPG